MSKKPIAKGDLARNAHCKWVRGRISRIVGQFAYFENGYCFPLISIRLLRRGKVSK